MTTETLGTEEITDLSNTVPTPVEPAPVGLSFADGFQFGCGFMAAVTLSLLIVLLALLTLILLLPLLGVNVL